MKKCIALLLTVVLPTFSGFAESTVETARSIYQQHGESLVWVLAVLDIEASAGGQQAQRQEQEIEVLGSVVHQEGLVAVSLSQLNPTIALRGRKVNTPAGPMQLETKVSYRNVRVLMEDGTEIPAKVLVTDEDIDLAVIGPDKDSEDMEEATYKPVDLASDATLSVLDPQILLYRLNKHMDRTLAVEIGQCAAVIKRPRTYYQCTMIGAGGSVYNAAGEFVGVELNRLNKGQPVMTVVVPAADLRDPVAQAVKKLNGE